MVAMKVRPIAIDKRIMLRMKKNIPMFPFISDPGMKMYMIKPKSVRAVPNPTSVKEKVLPLRL